LQKYLKNNVNKIIKNLIRLEYNQK
jgi:hypothetical protein